MDIMFDEVNRLRECVALFHLLDHYAEADVLERDAWQDRIMEWSDTKAEELVKLHGELIAYDWLEQNTGLTPVLQRGGVPRCYRVTASGLRALKLAKLDRSADEEYENEAA